jgi:hypothetical protein
MTMIAHKAISIKELVIPIIHLPQDIKPHPSILIILENGPPRIPSEDDMINSLSIFNP